jgi:hypothetical protein
MQTPPEAIQAQSRKEASTITRTRFYNTFDCRSPGESLPTVLEKIDFPYTLRTAEKWLKQRKQQPTTDPYRRPGKHRSGRPRSLIDDQLHALVDPKRNPIRDSV